MFSTAELFDEATTISKPVSSGRSRRIWHTARSIFHVTGSPTKARPGCTRSASWQARSTTLPATRSRSIVVLPVPGGPLTPIRPAPALRFANASLTANC
ncbi:Uncharacterised protein [Mycobacteroides abscessus subsp. abscessus]|nr:Uncharacterised protein [Mycobacteroides abscessus subsp. abscessus]